MANEIHIESSFENADVISFKIKLYAVHGQGVSPPLTMTITLDQLRHYAVARTLFMPTTLAKTIQRLGFVQAVQMLD